MQVDRLILELKLPPSDAYFKLKHVIEEVLPLSSSCVHILRCFVGLSTLLCPSPPTQRTIVGRMEALVALPMDEWTRRWMNGHIDG
jgi:hypothetical protein